MQVVGTSVGFIYVLDDQGKVFTGFPVQIGETIRHQRAAQSLLRRVSQLCDTTVRALVGALVGALGGVLVDRLLGSSVSAVVDSDVGGQLQCGCQSYTVSGTRA